MELENTKAISFDVDSTLWDFDTVMRRSLAAALKELQRVDPIAAQSLCVRDMISIRERVHHKIAPSGVDLVTIRLESFKEALRDADRPNNTLATRLNKVYFRHRYAEVSLFDDVIPAIKALASRYKLGVLSNGASYPSHFGLDKVFNFAVFSQDHGGIEKPDSRLFEIALSKAGCSPRNFLHIGDHIEHDIRGARDAGVRCIWLNRADLRPPRGSTTPDLQLTSLSQLGAFL